MTIKSSVKLMCACVFCVDSGCKGSGWRERWANAHACKVDERTDLALLRVL